MALVVTMSISTCSKNTDEKGNKYTQSGTGISITVHSGNTGRSGERKVNVGWSEPLHEQRAEENESSARENTASMHTCLLRSLPTPNGLDRERGRHVCVFSTAAVFCGRAGADCAVLKEVSCTAQDVLKHNLYAKHRTS